MSRLSWLLVSGIVVCMAALALRLHLDRAPIPEPPRDALSGGGGDRDFDARIEEWRARRAALERRRAAPPQAEAVARYKEMRAKPSRQPGIEESDEEWLADRSRREYFQRTSDWPLFIVTTSEAIADDATRFKLTWQPPLSAHAVYRSREYCWVISRDWRFDGWVRSEEVLYSHACSCAGENVLPAVTLIPMTHAGCAERCGTCGASFTVPNLEFREPPFSQPAADRR